MINLTPVLEALLSLAVLLMTLHVIPWVRERMTEDQQMYLQTMIRIAVYAAEKLYGAGHGSEKLQYAMGLLKQKNIEIDLEELKARINAEIRQMEMAEQKT